MVKLVDSKEISADFRFKIKQEFYLHEDGETYRRDVISHPGAALMIPQLLEDQFILIKQYRHAIRDYIFEFPAGTLEDNEEPIDCAKREIQEEVGYKASKWQELGPVIPTPGFCNEVIYCFLATDLSPSKIEVDEGELIEVVTLSRSEINQMIKDNRFIDGKSLSAWVKLNNFA